MERYILSFPGKPFHDWAALLGPWPGVSLRYVFESGKADIVASAQDIEEIRSAHPDLRIERIHRRPDGS